MVGVQGGSFELIFAFLDAECSVLFADEVEFADHFVVFCQVIRIDVESQDLLAAFASAHAPLELQFRLFTPALFEVLMWKVILSLKERHSM